MPFASKINLFAADIFDFQSAPDITSAEPTISEFLPSEGETISGGYRAFADVSDDYGIESVEYYVDGNFVAAAGNPSEPFRNIDTFNFTNGPHTMTVLVTNVMGNSASETHNIIVNNGTISFSVPSHRIDLRSPTSTSGWCDAYFTVQDSTTLGVEYLTVDGEYVLLDDPISGGSKRINVIKEAGSAFSGKDCYVVNVAAQDKLGGSYRQSITIDNTKFRVGTTSMYGGWCNVYMGNRC